MVILFVVLELFNSSKKLDETTAAMKKLAAALDQEKKKTDMLLYQMLPVKVANQLRDGKTVQAGRQTYSNRMATSLRNQFNYNVQIKYAIDLRILSLLQPVSYISKALIHILSFEGFECEYFWYCVAF